MDTDDRLLSEKLALAVELLADVFAARSVRHALICIPERFKAPARLIGQRVTRSAWPRPRG
jgi:hypothetical protein